MMGKSPAGEISAIGPSNTKRSDALKVQHKALMQETFAAIRDNTILQETTHV